MTDQEFVLTIITIVAATGFSFFFLGKFFSVARLKIERKYGKKNDSELHEEFEKFKQRAEKRLQVLESIVVEKDELNENPLLNDQDVEKRHSLEDQPRLKNMLRS
jgi:hypothetical protein